LFNFLECVDADRATSYQLAIAEGPQMSDVLDDIIDPQGITRRRGAHRGHRRIRFQVHVFRQRRVAT
jgi:hypothetical protein